MPQLFIVGDSITWGAWDPLGGWVQRLRSEIDRYQITNRDFWCPVYNLGISGNTSADVASRIADEIDARYKPDRGQEAIVLIAIGINDSIVHVRNPEASISEVTYRKNLERIFQQVQAVAKKIAFVGLTPVDEKLVYPINWEPRLGYANDRIATFNQVCRVFCELHQVSFVPVRETWMSRDYTQLLSDGLHPNAEGHDLLTQIVKNFLITSEFLAEPF